MPAKKAAAFGAGVSQAVSSFFNRSSDQSEPVADEGPSSGAAWSPPAGGSPDVAEPETPASAAPPSPDPAVETSGDAPAAEPGPEAGEVSGG